MSLRHFLLVGLLVLACLPALAPAAATTPPFGSLERKVLMDAVRAGLHLNLNSRFKVDYLRQSGGWAYFEGTAAFPMEDGEWQETDMTVHALLAREGQDWRVELVWTLPDDGKFSAAAFEKRLAGLRRQKHIPADLFD